MATMKTTEKRLCILGEDEIEALYGRPRFTHDERIQYFSLSPTEKAALEELHSLKSRLCFILQLGYFKARHLFFTFSLREVEEDVNYLRGQYFPDLLLTDLKITKVTRLKQQRLILKLCRYRSCGARERQQLDAKVRQAAMVCGKPVYIFRELMNYLADQRIVAPGYSSMQDTVSRALTYEQNRLITIARRHLKPFDIEAIKRPLADTQGLYEITCSSRFLSRLIC
jgi:Domain of unknown function (DUF4158)